MGQRHRHPDLGRDAHARLITTPSQARAAAVRAGVGGGLVVHGRVLTGAKEASQLNLFLYLVTPNPGWRNVGLPSRDGQGQSVLVIDKNVGNLAKIADRHYMIERGRTVWSGTSEQLLAEPVLQHRYLGI